MDNLTGYVKLINHIENNREHVYNVYVENYDNQIFRRIRRAQRKGNLQKNGRSLGC